MKTGEKLKRIRKFRGYNQPEFAIMVGMGENAAPRIAQYESGYRVPSPKLLKTMAEVLDCNPLALMDVTGQNVEELMMMRKQQKTRMCIIKIVIPGLLILRVDCGSTTT